MIQVPLCAFIHAENVKHSFVGIFGEGLTRTCARLGPIETLRLLLWSSAPAALRSSQGQHS
jgi:hypothetical protein